MLYLFENNDVSVKSIEDPYQCCGETKMKQDLKSDLNKNYMEIRDYEYYYIIISIIISIFICDNHVVQHDILISWDQTWPTMIGIHHLRFTVRSVATDDLFAFLCALICLEFSKLSSQIFIHPVNRQSFVSSYLLHFQG